MAEDAGFAQDLGTYSYFLMLSALTIVFFIILSTLMEWFCTLLYLKHTEKLKVLFNIVCLGHSVGIRNSILALILSSSDDDTDWIMTNAEVCLLEKLCYSSQPNNNLLRPIINDINSLRYHCFLLCTWYFGTYIIKFSLCFIIEY